MSLYSIRFLKLIEDVLECVYCCNRIRYSWPQGNGTKTVGAKAMEDSTIEKTPQERNNRLNYEAIRR